MYYYYSYPSVSLVCASVNMFHEVNHYARGGIGCHAVRRGAGRLSALCLAVRSTSIAHWAFECTEAASVGGEFGAIGSCIAALGAWKPSRSLS